MEECWLAPVRIVLLRSEPSRFYDDSSFFSLMFFSFFFFDRYGI